MVSHLGSVVLPATSPNRNPRPPSQLYPISQDPKDGDLCGQVAKSPTPSLNPQHLRSHEEAAPAEHRPCSQQMFALLSPPTPTCTPEPLSLYRERPPSPTTDLSHVPCGGAKRPRDPARTPGAAKLPRVDRGPGRRTRARPRCEAAEAAAETPGSAGGQGARPEPTTSRLPWLAMGPRHELRPTGLL